GGSDGLGIFGLSMEDGEFLGFNDGGRKPGVDDFAVDLFQRVQQTAHEERWIKLGELEAEMGRKQALYDSLTEEARAAGEEGAILTGLRTRLEQEVTQLDEEHAAMMRTQRHGNRDLNEGEKAAQHLRKTRRAELRRGLRDSHTRQASRHGAMALKKTAETQGLKVAQGLAVLRERARLGRESLESENQGLGNLPIVLGRSLHRATAAGVSMSPGASIGNPSEGAQKPSALSAITAGAAGSRTGAGLRVSHRPLTTENPKRALKDVEMWSRLEVVRADIEEALRLHRSLAVSDRESWLTSIEKRNQEDTYQGLLTRLAAGTERLKVADGENARESLINAIKLFSATGAKILLDHPVPSFEGTIPWWKYRDPKACLNMERWGSADDLGGGATTTVTANGSVREGRNVTRGGSPSMTEGEAAGAALQGQLSSPVLVAAAINVVEEEDLRERPDEEMGFSLGRAFAGHLVGVMPMPELALWTVRLAVTRHTPCSNEGQVGDETDWVRVKMGPTKHNMSEVGNVKNVLNEDLGEVRYELVHTFRGKELVFRFDFSSSSLEPQDHMAVETGQYATYEMEPLEWHGDRAVSSYVKELRLEEKSSLTKHTRLLEDMIKAEAAEGDFWDSKTLHATLQRYPRKEYVAMAKGELEDIKRKTKKSDGLDLTATYEKMGGNTDDKGAESLPPPPPSPDISRLTCPPPRITSKEAKALLQELTPEQRRELRSMRSQETYLARKRSLQQPRIEEARKLEGKRLEVYDGFANVWRKMKVSSVSVTWIENGTVARISHLLQPCDDSWVNLGDQEAEVLLDEVRWAEWSAGSDDSQAQEVSGEHTGKEIFEGHMKIVERMEAKLSRLRALMSREKADLERERKAEDKATMILRDQKVAQAKASSRAESTILAANDKKTRSEINSLAETLVGDWKLGISSPAGGATANLRNSRKEAKNKWIDDQVATASGKAELEFTFRAQEVAARRLQQDKNLERVYQEKMSIIDQECNAALAQLKQQADEDREKLIHERLAIPNFHLALQKGLSCPHSKTKAWGDKYGSGLRCVKCGMEATQTDKDHRQAAGIGFGEDPGLSEAVARHRLNEGGFRFDSTEQLQMVEEERIRLEKERRVSFTEYDKQFYDLDDPESMYEFDRRHKHWLKEHGVIRQGVLWRKEELLAWFDRRAGRNDELLNMELTDTEGDTEAAEMRGIMMDWYANATRAGPLTYRTYDGRRKARFLDILRLFNRIMNSNMRINELNKKKRDLTKERVSYRTDLLRVHNAIPSLDRNVRNCERELGEADRMIKMREEASSQHLHWVDVLAEATRDLTESEIKLAGREFLAEKSNAALRDSTDKLENIIMHRLRCEATRKALAERLEIVNENRTRLSEETQRLMQEIELFYYTKRHSRVETSLGWATVASYRESDRMLIVTMPFGRPPARMWIPVQKVWQLDKAKQQAEVVAMEAEDIRGQILFKAERATIAHESSIMLLEERETRELMRVEAEQREEAQLAVDIVDTARTAAPRLVKLPAVREHMEAWVAHKVQKAVEEREKIIQRYKRGDESIQEKPRKVYGQPERALMARRFRQEFGIVFVENQIKNAEFRVEKMMEARARARGEQKTLDQIIGTFVADFIRDLAGETLRAGLEARKRAEEETGLIFPDPPHMQYELYLTLCKWWMGHKHQLKRKVEMWSIVVAKNAEKFEREQARASEACQTHWERQRKEETRVRVAKACEEMAAEEEATRKFLVAEWHLTLSERRGMMVAERETRREATAPSQQERLRHLEESEAELRARKVRDRKAELAAMTEEEREVAVQEDEQEKKAAWQKKQAQLLGIAPVDGDSILEDAGSTLREQRRVDIKVAKLERRREEVENRLMEEEDRRSMTENEEFKAALHLKQQREQQIAQLMAKMHSDMAAEMTASMGSGEQTAELMKAMGMMMGARAITGKDERKGGEGEGDGHDAEMDIAVHGGGPAPHEVSEGESCRNGKVEEEKGVSFFVFSPSSTLSSESELCDEDRKFAEAMGLPTGNIEESDSNPEDEEEDHPGPTPDKIRDQEDRKSLLKKRPHSALQGDGNSNNERPSSMGSLLGKTGAVDSGIMDRRAENCEESGLVNKGGMGAREGRKREDGGGEENRGKGQEGEEVEREEDKMQSEEEIGSEKGIAVGGDASEEDMESSSGSEGKKSEEGEVVQTTAPEATDLGNDSEVEEGKWEAIRRKDQCFKGCFFHFTLPCSLSLPKYGNAAGSMKHDNSNASNSPNNHPSWEGEPGSKARGLVGKGIPLGGRKAWGGQRALLVGDNSSDESEGDLSSDEEKMGRGSRQPRGKDLRREKEGGAGQKMRRKRKKKGLDKKELEGQVGGEAQAFRDAQEILLAEMRQQQKKALKRRIRRKLGRQKVRIVKRLRRAAEIRETEERQIAMRLEQAHQIAQLANAKAELSWLEAEEEAKRLEKRSAKEEENYRKLDLFCQRSAREEMDARVDADKKNKLARDCRTLHDEAAQWKQICGAKEHRAMKWLQRVKKETKFFNGMALTENWQRWETDWIHSQLYSLYFKSLVDTIVNRAELIGAERAMMHVHDKLRKTDEQIKLKEALVAKLWKKQKRRELIYLRRSELGKRMFGRSQRASIRAVFEGWLKFHTWLRSMREAFQLKYSVIKQGLDLNRLYSEIDDQNQRSENTTAMYGGGTVPRVRKTLLQRFKERPIVCRNCQSFYLESQNHDLICPYHPGEFKRACPRSCPGMTEKCMSHRVMRWTCCDSKEPGSWGSSGCKRRYHMPPADGHPEFVEIVKKGAIEDKMAIADLDKELQELHSKDMRSTALMLKQKQLSTIAAEIQKERSIVARYKDLKFA
ncbi:unnamed protein product, partial [Discosporangium mesarthrocarpum]